MERSVQLKKGIVVLVTVIAFIYGYQLLTIGDCKKRINYKANDLNRGIKLDSLFQPISTSEYQHVLTDWNQFDLKSDHFEVITTK